MRHAAGGCEARAHVMFWRHARPDDDKIGIEVEGRTEVGLRINGEMDRTQPRTDPGGAGVTYKKFTQDRLYFEYNRTNTQPRGYDPPMTPKYARILNISVRSHDRVCVRYWPFDRCLFILVVSIEIFSPLGCRRLDDVDNKVVAYASSTTCRSKALRGARSRRAVN
ncbi:hypothetical protein EVAR_58988_1 [Eumeta japonica]|uniref:Uncharacterized protein n=1 Tax=Eumeta variegata TaxID=151549 RepID=A0A4C1YJA5_EUMVA|nr:hypothetical protein EVAR_58988_1 [Eumeta japonica]